MTLPYEQVYSVQNTRRFLLDLLDPTKTPRVPKSVRMRARGCLKHFPWDGDIESYILGKQSKKTPSAGRNTGKPATRNRP